MSQTSVHNPVKAIIQMVVKPGQLENLESIKLKLVGVKELSVPHELTTFLVEDQSQVHIHMDFGRSDADNVLMELGPHLAQLSEVAELSHVYIYGSPTEVQRESLRVINPQYFTNWGSNKD